MDENNNREAFRVRFTRTNTACWARIVVFGNTNEDGQIFFEGEYYLSTRGIEGTGLKRGSDSITILGGPGTFFAGNESGGAGVIKTPLVIHKPFGPLDGVDDDDSTSALIKLRTSGLANPGFSAKLYFEVVGNEIADVFVGGVSVL